MTKVEKLRSIIDSETVEVSVAELSEMFKYIKQLDEVRESVGLTWSGKVTMSMDDHNKMYTAIKALDKWLKKTTQSVSLPVLYRGIMDSIIDQVNGE